MGLTESMRIRQGQVTQDNSITDNPPIQGSSFLAKQYNTAGRTLSNRGSVSNVHIDIKLKGKDYSSDPDFAYLVMLCQAYNAEPSVANEIAVANTAMNYIDKYGTGKKLKNKACVLAAESILYQLTMKNGQTQAAANQNVERLSANIVREEGTTDKGYTQVLDAMQIIKNINQGTGDFSPTLQMITAEVMANQTKTPDLIANSGSGSGANREWEPGRSNYKYKVTIGSSKEDSSTTASSALHEFTHVSASEAYDNYLPVTFDKNATAEEILAIRDDRVSRANSIFTCSPKDYEALNFSRHYLYLWQDKMISNYIPNYIGLLGDEKTHTITSEHLKKIDEDFELLKRLQEALSERQNDYINMAEEFNQRKTNLKKHRDQFDKGSKAYKEADLLVCQAIDEQMAKVQAGETTLCDNILIEYDSVINQMLIEYETKTKDRSSELYRKLKAAALRAHVDRHNAKLKRDNLP